MKTTCRIEPYTVSYDVLDRGKMRYLESITALSNGFMGTRGNFEETYTGDTLNGTYIAGVWYPDKTKVGWWKNGYPDYFGKVINAVKITGIRAFAEDEEIDLYKMDVSDFLMTLDMKNALLTRTAVVKTKSGRIKLEAKRFLSFSNKNICAVSYKLIPLDKDITITLIPYLDNNVRNQDSNYDEIFWQINETECFHMGGYVEASTKQNPFNDNKFKVGAAMKVASSISPIYTEEELSLGYAAQRMVFETKKDNGVCVEKIIAVNFTSDYDTQIKTDTIEMLNRLGNKSFDDLKYEHQEIFSKIFDECDVEIVGDESAQQGIRFNLFQLISTYDGKNPKLNIGPKGMTGEKYGGAAYWDTEAFLIPFYLGTAPMDVAKNLLLFRYCTLEKAKENASKIGVKGALYPMVTFDGTECHNEWEITFEEIHRNGSMVYAIYNYVTYTGDTDYIKNYGFHVVLEVARFWADRVHYNKEKDCYMIHGVTGPNEYENNVNNNWYTNFIAKWCLEYAHETGLKYESFFNDLYTDDELRGFKQIADKMYMPYDKKRDIFIQHDTFLDKVIEPASSIPTGERPLNEHWSWDKILRSCFIKQADVLQGLYFFNHRFSDREVKNNFDFYEPLTVHESSLSASIHSVIASRIGEKKRAYDLYTRTARLDLDDINNDTRDGLHVTSMSGSWLAITQGFAGMSTITGKLTFAPYLPESFDKYSFKIRYKGRLVLVSIDSESIIITKLKGDETNVTVYDKIYTLENSLEIRLEK